MGGWRFRAASPAAPVSMFVLLVGAGCGSTSKSSRAPRGDVTVIASSQSDAEALAVDSTSVYWTESSTGTVMKVPIAGGTPTLVVSGQTGVVAIAVTGAHVYWTTSSLFVASAGSNPTSGLFEVHASGGTPVTLASAIGESPDLKTDGTNICWPVPVTLASGQAGPTNLTVDASGVYWINEGCPGTFAAAAREGEGAVMRLARE
jgi:hypothetical protein